MKLVHLKIHEPLFTTQFASIVSAIPRQLQKTVEVFLSSCTRRLAFFPQDPQHSMIRLPYQPELSTLRPETWFLPDVHRQDYVSSPFISPFSFFFSRKKFLENGFTVVTPNHQALVSLRFISTEWISRDRDKLLFKLCTILSDSITDEENKIVHKHTREILVSEFCRVFQTLGKEKWISIWNM